MGRGKFWIDLEPSGEDYAQLVEFCARRCSKCTFTMERPQLFGENCHQFLARQKKDLIKVVSQTEWPGTRLVNSSASVHWYHVTTELIAAIKAKVDRLYDWVLPDLPEDLAFYWPSGSPLLGTSSHERFAFLNLTEEELDEFFKAGPNLRLNKGPLSD